MLIGEVSERSGISTRMLRHYDALGIVSASSRTSNGYRSYSSDDFLRLFQVEAWRSLGLGLREIGDVINDLAFDAEFTLTELMRRTERQIAQQQELLEHLHRVQAGTPSDWQEVLETIELMRGLDTDSASKRVNVALSIGNEKERNVALLLEAAFQERDTNAAGALDWVLAALGDDIVPSVRQELDAPSQHRRHRAVVILSKLGSSASETALANAYPHSDPFVHRRAALAHGRRGGRDAISALIGLIVDGDEDVEAAEILADLAETTNDSTDIAREIARALTTQDAPARQRLAAALADMTGEPAQKMLEELLDDPDRGVALTAKHLLEKRS